MPVIQMGEYTVKKTHGRWMITSPERRGTIEIYGNGHAIETFYAVPDWKEPSDMDAEEEAFKYKGEIYFISDFMRIDQHAPAWMKEFDGYRGDSFFSGILLRYDEDLDSYQAYTWIC